MRAPGVRIIAITGGGPALGPEIVLEIADAFGAVRVMKKPFDVDEILAAVEDALGG